MDQFRSIVAAVQVPSFARLFASVVGLAGVLLVVMGAAACAPVGSPLGGGAGSGGGGGGGGETAVPPETIGGGGRSDRDRDGFARSVDCADNNAAVYPGATEICGNAIDEDCDGSDLVCGGGGGTIVYADADSDGWTSDVDCADADSAIHPGVAEICSDAVDQDCSGADLACPDVDGDTYPSDIDCDDTNATYYTVATFYTDTDLDSFGDVGAPANVCVPTASQVANSLDCNDANGNVYPGAPEQCNDADDDCDAIVDESIATSTFYLDSDSDGFGDSSTSVTDCVAPANYILASGDCNDANASYHANADYYPDADSDGYGANVTASNVCVPSAGYVLITGDCEDGIATASPVGTETCNTVDDDCDGTVDEGVLLTIYADADGDGFGNSASSSQSCSVTAGNVSNSSDCDDTSANRSPINPEICDGVDNDCDSTADDGLTFTTYYQDSDGDTFGNASVSQSACAAVVGYVTNSTDCNDGSTSVKPGASDVCGNSVDEDCSGTDATCPDADGDTYASNVDCNDANASVNPGINESAPPLCGNGLDEDCSGVDAPCADADSDGYSAAIDCADNNASRYPGAPEVCEDSIDQDCDGSDLTCADVDGDTFRSNADCDDTNPLYHEVLSYYTDGDLDAHGDPATEDARCVPLAGQVLDNTDCNDAANNVYPGRAEDCDGIDNDCDSVVDDNVATSTFYADSDSDGYGNSSSTVDNCLQPAGYVANSTDCNDANGSYHTNQTFYTDADSDAFGANGSGASACVPAGNQVLSAGDCNDASASIKPGATELCNSLDDNCNGQIDEGVQSQFFADTDSDNYGNPASSQFGCAASPPSGYVLSDTDCNDSSAAAYPGNTEVCDSIDNNCNNQVDDGVSFQNYYADSDSDTYGDLAVSQNACAAPSGYVLNSTDCDDANPAIKPGATDVCDAINNDCDGSTDEDATFTTYYRDFDSDNYGTSGTTQQACSGAPVGYVAAAGDCNESSAAINPGATETCNSIDDDCDSSIDEGLTFTTYYRDLDSDTYGNAASTTSACSGMPSGYVANSTDCNDNNAAIKPGVTEVCDGVDNNCNGQIDEGVTTTYYRDVDGDGYGVSSPTSQACSAPAGYSAFSTDCNDGSASINPGAAETCNGVDDNCSGAIDEGVTTTYYRDADGDTFGTSGTSQQACSAPVGYVANSTDCNDGNAAIKPGATEVCDQVDNNCSGAADEGLTTTAYYQDSDGDTYGNPDVYQARCNQPSGYVSNNTDCLDTNANVKPGGTELCGNGLNDDCSATGGDRPCITKIASGESDQTCIIMSDGNVKCWGLNSSGQLGLGNTSTIGDNELPSTIGNLSIGVQFTAATHVSVGSGFTCVAYSSNVYPGRSVVHCWGKNNFGQLGVTAAGTGTGNYGDNESIYDAWLVNTTPVGVTVSQLVSGDSHSCVLLSNNVVRCWGANFYGQLGIGHTNNWGDGNTTCGASGGPEYALNPSLTCNTVSFVGGKTPVQLVAHGWHTCARMSDGTVQCWGYNNVGQMGLGNSPTNQVTPQVVNLGFDTNNPALPLQAVNIAATEANVCVRTNNSYIQRRFICWGNGTGVNGYGNLTTVGDNETVADYTDGTPVFASDNFGFRSSYGLVSSSFSVCAISETSKGPDGVSSGVYRYLSCWGVGNSGVLGNSSTATIGDDETMVSSAVTPEMLSDTGAGGSFKRWLVHPDKIGGGYRHMCAVVPWASTEFLRCWGFNNNGQLGQGNTTTIGDNEKPWGTVVSPYPGNIPFVSYAP